MKQAFQVFLKDVRRLRVELVISMAALALLTWAEWQLCTPARNPQWYNQLLPSLILFLAWWLMIAQLIHGDALTGDRQFWATRPYVWYQLLLAKVLFVVACIGVPLLASQAVLVLIDGVPLLPNFAEMIHTGFATLVVGILPIAAIAVITRSLSRWMIGLAVLIILMIGMAALDSEIPNSHVPTGIELSDTLQAIAFACLAGFGITMKYARRHRRIGFFAIAAAVLAVPVIMVATPYRAIIRARFPVVSLDHIPFRVAFLAAQGMTGTADTGVARLTIPIQMTRIPPDMILRLDGVMLSLDLSDGSRWDSEWQPAFQEVTQDGVRVPLRIEIDRAVYRQAGTHSVPVRLSVALSQFADQHRRRVVVYRRFELPGVGSCWLDKYIDYVTCRSTASSPPLLLATISKADSTCPALRGPVEEGNIIRILDSSSASGPLSPLNLRNLRTNGVCPGTPVVFSTPEFVRRFRFELPLGSLRLNEYNHEKLARAGLQKGGCARSAQRWSGSSMQGSCDNPN